MEALIEAKQLTKRYRGSSVDALHDLNLAIKPGEVYGFLGANGAGKTTAIRVLLNLLQPTSGSASICGLDIVADSVEAKRHIGYLSGEIAIYPRVTTREFVAYMAKLQPPKHPDYTAKLIKRLEIDASKPIEELSKGNRQKVGILQAFMHEPEVLILDEPTSGLDPLMQEEFFGLIAEAKARGAAIFLSSHNLAEAQRICDRVGIIKSGKLIREQAVSAGAALGKPVFRLVLAQAAVDLAKLNASKQIRILSSNGQEVVVQPTGNIAGALAVLSKAQIVSIATDKLDLENEFLEFYGDTTSD